MGPALTGAPSSRPPLGSPALTGGAMPQSSIVNGDGARWPGPSAPCVRTCHGPVCLPVPWPRVSARAIAPCVGPCHSPVRRPVPWPRASARAMAPCVSTGSSAPGHHGPRPHGQPSHHGPRRHGSPVIGPAVPEPVITAPPSREPRPHGRGYAAILRCFRHGNDRGRPRWRYYCRSRWRLTVLFGFEFTASGRRTGDSPGSTRTGGISSIDACPALRAERGLYCCVPVACRTTSICISRYRPIGPSRA